MVSPSLENVRLRVAFPVMKAAVDDMLSRFDAISPGTRVNLDAEMAHVTADIIFRAIFSRPLTREASRDVFDAFGDYQDALPHLDVAEVLYFTTGSLLAVPLGVGRQDESHGTYQAQYCEVDRTKYCCKYLHVGDLSKRMN